MGLQSLPELFELGRDRRIGLVSLLGRFRLCRLSCLGGLRIGWGYGPRHVIDVLNRIRGPFNLSTTQQEAAEAAVRDQDFVAKCRSENTRMRSWLANALAEIGVPSDTSMANFILARFASQEEAEACDAFLQKQGLIVHKNWQQRRIDFQPYPFASYTEELVRAIGQTKVEGDTRFLSGLDPKFVARDLVDDRFVRKAIAEVGGPAAFGLPANLLRSETVAV